MWQLYNVCKRTKAQSVSGDLEKCFFQSHSDLESMLTAPIPDDHIHKLCAANVMIGPRCFLLKLPAEIRVMILDALSTGGADSALVFLSVTCKTLLATSEPYLAQRTARTVGSWADCRLICTGDHCDYHTLPPKLFTDAERALLAPYIAANQGGDLVDDDLYVDEDVYPSAEGAMDHLAKVDPVAAAKETSVSVVTAELDELYRMRGGESAVHRRDRARIERVLAPYPPRADLVVANVSKGEYVRAPAVDALGEGKTLAHVVLSRVCWSPHYDIGEDAGLRKGVWAGDRFRITTMERLPEPLCGGAWQDVTATMCRHLQAIWTAKFLD